MKPGAHFKKAGDAAFQCHPARRRRDDTAQNFQQRRFSRAILSNDSNTFTPRNRKADIVEREKSLSRRFGQPIREKRLRFIREYIA